MHLSNRILHLNKHKKEHLREIAAEMERPSTPLNMITGSEHPPGVLRSPLKSPVLQTDTTLTTPGFMPNFTEAITPNVHHETEAMLTGMLELLGDPSVPLDRLEVKHVLEKCLVTLSHYKLQNNILRFESQEQGKRNAIETELIKSEVDFLLKSPFKPSYEKSVQEERHTPRGMLSKSKVAKPRLKLVERHGKKDDEFGNCVKVFHLKKKN
jgi:hypothetical protein